MNPANGRFQTMDSYEGNTSEPLSLQKYLYANADGVNKSDPSGFFSIEMELGSLTVRNTISTMSTVRNIAVAAAITCALDFAVTGTLNELGAELQPITPCDAQNNQKGFLFRGDDYHIFGTPMGIPLDTEEAELADVQTVWEHINHDHMNGGTSRYKSFSRTLVKARKFGSKIYKVAWKDILILELTGQIRLYYPETVEQKMLDNGFSIREARETKNRMNVNEEVLIEGQIPAISIKKAKT